MHDVHEGSRRKIAMANTRTELNSKRRHQVSATATMELEGYVHCEQARGNVEADGDVKLQTTESIA
jgi:hypothetical protein